MPKKKRYQSTQSDEYDMDYDEDISSNESRNPGQPPIQRNAANARERARMRVLSSAFCRLKTKLPWVPADTKLSKLDTLRLATIYIQQLRASLSKDDEDDDCFFPVTNSQSMVWPFSFQQHLNNRQMGNFGLNQWISRSSPDAYLKQYSKDSVMSSNNNNNANESLINGSMNAIHS